MFTQSITWDDRPLKEVPIFPHSAIGGQKLVGLVLKDEYGRPEHQILFCWVDDVVLSIPYVDGEIHVDGVCTYINTGGWTLHEIYHDIIKNDFDADLEEWQPIFE